MFFQQQTAVLAFGRLPYIVKRIDESPGEQVIICLNKSAKGKSRKIADLVGECQSFEILRSGSREPGRIVVSPFDYQAVLVKL